MPRHPGNILALLITLEQEMTRKALTALALTLLACTSYAQQQRITPMELQQQMNLQRELDRRQVNQQQHIQSLQSQAYGNPYSYQPIQQSEVAPVLLSRDYEAEKLEWLIQRMEEIDSKYKR